MPASRIRSIAAPALTVGLVASACSASPPPASVAETIVMTDFAYRADQPIAIKKGSTVRFVFHNTGTVPHEAFIGDVAAQDAHDKVMAGMGTTSPMNMSASAAEVTVDPGKTASLTYTFKRPGGLLIGCHYPGHYAAGMHIGIAVT